MAPVASTDALTKKLVLWGLRIIVALIFLTPAVLSLWGHAGMVKQFDALGLGRLFRITLAIVQCVAALLVLFPRASLIAAVVLLLLDATVFLSELLVAHGGFVHLILFAFPLLALISMQSGRFDKELAELDE